MITKRVRAAVRALWLAARLWHAHAVARRCALCDCVIPNDTAIRVCGRCIAGR